MIFMCIFFSGVWAMAEGLLQVVHRQIQLAKTGENVTLQCQLLMDYEVLQVTWQKESGDGKGNIATYSKVNGQRILGDYEGHVHFAQSELMISAIAIHAVSLQDEGCYKCIFNAFPMGSITGRTCLKIYAILEPRLEAKLVSHPDNAEEEMLEISCSVTGKPPPVISWNLSYQLEQEPGQYLISHANRTVTVISNFTYVPSRIHWEQPPNCVIQHPLLNKTLVLSREEPLWEPPATVSAVNIYVLIPLILFGVLCISCLCYCWKQQRQMDRNKAALCWILPTCTKDVRHGLCTKNDKQNHDKLPPLTDALDT